jgi:GntR family transcriptional repressor for pyruvate dehydrogenase complex
VERLGAAMHDSSETTYEARRFQEKLAEASNNLVLGFLVNALHRMSHGSGIEYDLEQRQAHLKHSQSILRAIEAGDAEKAFEISTKMHAASKRYWEKNAPELLDTPVSWVIS